MIVTLIALLLWSPSVTATATEDESFDIVIYGATSGGVVAAQAASMQGMKVLLLDPGRHLGGMSSGGLGQTDIGNKFAITGLSRQFYRRVGAHYGKDEQWTFEPHVALRIFQDIIREYKIDYRPDHRLVEVKRDGNVIRKTVFQRVSRGGRVAVSAKVFIDCTYEGDLMALAGVTYVVGREDNSRYGETFNGVQLLDKHQFPIGVDPYVVPGKPESGLLWGISPDKLAPAGSGDRKLQAYNFRLCLTDDPANRIAVTRPERYDASHYELLLRQIKAYTPDSLNWQLMHFAMMPNRKTDINNCGGFSTDMIGANYRYPEADWPERERIIRAHEDYTKGLLYFIGNDPRVPAHLREEMMRWGYPKDEYADHGNFTPQLYIRESRRMVGTHVMTQHHCQGKERVSDGIGYAAYTMDSHNCQRLVVDGMVRNEGDVQVGGFPPYPVSYGSLVPRESECRNLLVPVCLSASHIAYGSIRMEPVFMVLGEAAAIAATMSIRGDLPVQRVDVMQLQRKLNFK